jgi:hypothetical protein
MLSGKTTALCMQNCLHTLSCTHKICIVEPQAANILKQKKKDNWIWSWMFWAKTTHHTLQGVVRPGALVGF